MMATLTEKNNLGANEAVAEKSLTRPLKDATPSGRETSNPLKRPLPNSPDIDNTMMTTDTLPPSIGHRSSSTQPPEGVNGEVWDMLLSIKRDTAKAIEYTGSLDTRLLALEDSHDNTGADIYQIKRTLKQVVEHNKVITGRLIRAETTIERQRSEITDLRMRSMRDNVIIRTRGQDYKETINENTASVFWRFVATEMNVPNADKFCITRAHRMGQSRGQHNKMMIAKLAFDNDQRRVFDNAKSLKGTDFSISKQLPQEIEERRQFAWQEFKRARGAKLPANFVGGRLMVSGRAVDKYDAIQLPTESKTLYGGDGATVGPPSEVVDVDGHEFVARFAKVSSMQGVREAIDTLLKDEVFFKATHMPYAFRFQDADGQLYENFSSDDDNGAGLHMLRELQKCSAMNLVVCAAHVTADTQVPYKRKLDALGEVVRQVATAPKDGEPQVVEGMS